MEVARRYTLDDVTAAMGDALARLRAEGSSIRADLAAIYIREFIDATTDALKALPAEPDPAGLDD